MRAQRSGFANSASDRGHGKISGFHHWLSSIVLGHDRSTDFDERAFV